VTLYQSFISSVQSGELPSNKWVKLSVERHLSDVKRAEETGFVFDEAEAERVLGIFAALRHTKGQYAKKPFALLPWQAFIVVSLFGWKVAATGQRRYRKAYVEVARKNGKTEIAAAIGLILAMFDGEHGAEVYSVANKLEQASICFDAGCIMMKALQKDVDDESVSAIEIFNSQNHRKIVNRTNNSFFRPIPTEAKTQDGYNVHGGIIDEYHEATDDSSLRILETGTVARTQPLLFIITTAGFNRNGPCYQLRKVICDILEGKKKDESLFGLVFTLDEDDDWEDERNWIKANPSIGITPTWEAMRSQYTKAKNEGETARINFLTKNLNIWTTVSKTWIKDEDWMRNAAPIDMGLLRGRECYGGLDLASVRDITALILFFPARNSDERHIALSYFWIPEDGADQRSRDDGVPYLQWIADGAIEATPGNVTDYGWVKSRILDLCELYQPESIAYDRFNASQLVIELQEEGVKMEPFGQGFVSMSAPTRQIEKMILSGELNHGGNEVLRWMCGNVTLRIDPAGNIKMDKGKSQEKIDGMVALAMAIGEWMTGDKAGPSKYEEDEMVVL